MPIRSSRKLVTSCLLYPNGLPHLGHAAHVVSADFIHRYRIMRGYRSRLLVGIDEHAPTISEIASREKMTVRDYCNQMAEKHRVIWKGLHVDESFFFRTSQPEHQTMVQDVIRRLRDQGDIYEAPYQPFHSSEPGEKHFFFRTSKYTERWLDMVLDIPQMIRPNPFRRRIINFVRDAVTDIGERNADLAISRPNLPYGVPFPESKVPNERVYVWFDALIAYLTAAEYGKPSFDEYWPADFHMVGYDVIKHELRTWPYLILALGLPLPKTFWIHGMATQNGEIIGKSNGHGYETIEKFLGKGVDCFRWSLAYQFSSKPKVEFRLPALEGTQTLLINNIGIPFQNLIQAILYLDLESIPLGEMSSNKIDREQEVNYFQFMEQNDFSTSVRALILHAKEIVSLQNSWVAEGVFAERRTSLSNQRLSFLLELWRQFAVLAWPFIPKTAEEILRRLGIQDTVGANIRAVSPLRQTEMVFKPRISSGPLLFEQKGIN